MHRLKFWRHGDAYAVLIFVAFLFGCALTVLITSESGLEPLSADAIRYNKMSGATVKINVYIEMIDENGNEKIQLGGHGSGVIVAREGLAHFVQSARHVGFDDGDSGKLSLKIEHPHIIGEVDAKILTSDKENDLLLLLFIADKGLPVATIASHGPDMTEDVWLYGHGLQYYAFSTKGIMSAKSGSFPGWAKKIIVTAQVWYGCSGGGLWNADGEFVGTVTSIKIERNPVGFGSIPLPWQCGVVPLSVVKDFLKKSGFIARKTINFSAATSPDDNSGRWDNLFPHNLGE